MSNCRFHYLSVRGEGIEPSSPGSKPGSLPLADPQAVAAGIEPASACLTGTLPYQHGTPQKLSQDGWIRTSDLVHPRHAESSTFLHPDYLQFHIFNLRSTKSAQWELNPHFRHGKAVGCRYIMGAFIKHQIVNDQWD